VHVPVEDIEIVLDACIVRVSEGEPVPVLEILGLALYVGEPVLVFEELELPVIVLLTTIVLEGLLVVVDDCVSMKDSVIRGDEDAVFESADDSLGFAVGSIVIVKAALYVLA